MDILKFYDKPSDEERFILNRLPNIKINFRNQFSVSGKKYLYEDISKVKVTTKDKFNI